jgi:hypothetical protein
MRALSNLLRRARHWGSDLFDQLGREGAEVWSTFDGAGVLTSIVDGKELVQALERDWSDGLEPLSFFTPMNSQDE